MSVALRAINTARAADRSPVLAAFLDVVRVHCREVGSRLDEVLARHPAACSAG